MNTSVDLMEHLLHSSILMESFNPHTEAGACKAWKQIHQQYFKRASRMGLYCRFPLHGTWKSWHKTIPHAVKGYAHRYDEAQSHGRPRTVLMVKAMEPSTKTQNALKATSMTCAAKAAADSAEVSWNNLFSNMGFDGVMKYLEDTEDHVHIFASSSRRHSFM